MEFKQFRAFVAVVENKSFSEAARQLNLTQPTISAHINSLEQELNSRLLIRTTKKLNITQRGLLLYDCASNMLNMRSNIIEEFTGQNKKIIDLAVSTIPSSYLLPDILSAFTNRYRTYTSIPGNPTALALYQEYWMAAWIWHWWEIPLMNRTAVLFLFAKISL